MRDSQSLDTVFKRRERNSAWHIQGSNVTKISGQQYQNQEEGFTRPTRMRSTNDTGPRAEVANRTENYLGRKRSTHSENPELGRQNLNNGSIYQRDQLSSQPNLITQNQYNLLPSHQVNNVKKLQHMRDSKSSGSIGQIVNKNQNMMYQ